MIVQFVGTDKTNSLYVYVLAGITYLLWLLSAEKSKTREPS